MRRAFPCALLLACISQAATIETSCEWIDTGETCGVVDGVLPVLRHSVVAEAVDATLSVTGSIMADVADPGWQEISLSYSYRDSLTFSFVVLGGEGTGFLQGYASGYQDFPHPQPQANLTMDTNWRLSSSFVGSRYQLPFTYGVPITFFMNASYEGSSSEAGYFGQSVVADFSLRPPEGAYFQSAELPVTENPEPGTAALIAFGIAGLLFHRRRLCRR